MASQRRTASAGVSIFMNVDCVHRVGQKAFQSKSDGSATVVGSEKYIPMSPQDCNRHTLTEVSLNTASCLHQNVVFFASTFGMYFCDPD